MKEPQPKIPDSSGFQLYWKKLESIQPWPKFNSSSSISETEVCLESTGIRVRFGVWGRTLISHVRSEGLHFVLHGNLSVPVVRSAEELGLYLAPICRSHAPEGLGLYLRGSFVLIVIDSRADKVFVVTDRNGSRKIFNKKGAEHEWIGTSVECLPDRRPDPAGVASLMINDFCFLGRTVIENVSLLERASIYCLGKNGLGRTCYWEPDYSSKNFTLSENEMEDAYEKFMTQAVRRAIPESGRVLVSLSGGVDSRAILGLLMSEPGLKNRLLAFSYGQEDDDDVRVARELCAISDIPHKVLCYQGNLAETIRRNGTLSEGLVSFYTHGLDGLFALEKEFGSSDIMFVGDIAFRQGASSFGTLDEMLTHGVGIRTPVSIPYWYGYGRHLPADVANQLSSDIAILKRRISHIKDLSDANHYLLLDQRQNYQILPWREFYTGRFIRVANPLIDEDILDFVATVPSLSANNKKLHRQTVIKMFPELCRIPFAASGVTNSYAYSDIISQRAAVMALLETHDSHIDDLIPPEVIKIAVIQYIETCRLDRYKLPKFVRDVIDKARWKYSSAALHFSLGKSSKEINTAHPWKGGIPKLAPRQLLKLLSIRYFFRKQPLSI